VREVALEAQRSNRTIGWIATHGRAIASPQHERLGRGAGTRRSMAVNSATNMAVTAHR
jgi:hypothetical protein